MVDAPALDDLEELECAVCARHALACRVERAAVRSNVRAFMQQVFRVWRCPFCRSIHARDFANLSHYYAAYPFHSLRRDARTRLVHQHLLGRLRRAGLSKRHSILDYGCGGGHFVEFLREEGYTKAAGYDAYHPDYCGQDTLERQYDFVVSQDVIEHADDPERLLADYAALTRPGSRLVVGTPNAEAIDLRRPEDFVHTLHAPYHRHIWAIPALIDRLGEFGFALEAVYDTMYTNTPFPGLNEAFYVYYARLNDDTLDAILGPVQVRALLCSLPQTLFWAFFGSAFARGTDCMLVLERP